MPDTHTHQYIYPLHALLTTAMPDGRHRTMVARQCRHCGRGELAVASGTRTGRQPLPHLSRFPWRTVTPD